MEYFDSWGVMAGLIAAVMRVKDCGPDGHCWLRVRHQEKLVGNSNTELNLPNPKHSGGHVWTGCITAQWVEGCL